jgi:hypothetical protein
MAEVLTNKIKPDDVRIEPTRELHRELHARRATATVVEMYENGFPVHDAVSFESSTR